MENIESIRYNNNFINQVICRVDFLDVINQSVISDSKIIQSISKCFPIKGMDQIIRFNSVTIDNPDPTIEPLTNIQSIQGVQSTYSNNEGNKFILTNKCFIVEYNLYNSFEDFINSFIEVLKLLFDRNKIVTERIGLRYINIFDSKKKKILKSYFPSSVSQATQANQLELDSKFKTLRSIQTIEYAYNNLNVNFRYGVINSRYPAPITDTEFILDYDCYVQELFNTSFDIIKVINESHDAIQNIFENSITDKLREVMKNG